MPIVEASWSHQPSPSVSQWLWVLDQRSLRSLFQDDGGIYSGAYAPALHVIPPSTTSSIPVTYFASSEARNSAALATSKASPMWPIGTCASRARHIASTSPLA